MIPPLVHARYRSKIRAYPGSRIHTKPPTPRAKKSRRGSRGLARFAAIGRNSKRNPAAPAAAFARAQSSAPHPPRISCESEVLGPVRRHQYPSLFQTNASASREGPSATPQARPRAFVRTAAFPCPRPWPGGNLLCDVANVIGRLRIVSDHRIAFRGKAIGR